mgnify:CR=1 FL=1
MTPEQRTYLINALERGEDLSPEWARILFPPEKREYELVYHGKEREEDIIANTLAVPLHPVRTFNKNGQEWHNKLIFGDNLQAMKRLVEMKKTGELCSADGTPGAKLIYIDPPFATKRDFQGSQEQQAYQDKVIGAAFLEFLRRRLIMMKHLLADDGYIFVHLDQKKSHYVKVLMDEVFGEHNFLNHIIWSYRRWPSRSRNFQSMHDDILMYASKASNPKRAFHIAYEAPSESYLKRFQGKTQFLDEETGTRKITVDEPTKGMPLRDVWELSIIAGFKGERTDYPTQKPESLLGRIIEICSDPGDLVLDAFAGSGTTCAAAEKLNRRWVAIDCGKLAAYTIQKRMLNLKAEIGHSGKALKAKPFTLYNAGLYDFSRLKELPWEDWRRFGLTLFGCRDEPHVIGGIRFDGTLKACPVQVFDHRQHGGATVSEETLRSIHEAAGSRLGSRMFIIAPSLAFDFQQDYIQIDDVRYYALRIPYSIIHKLHHRDFLALKQPADELAVNDTVDAVGFDFIRTPELDYRVGRLAPDPEKPQLAFLQIERFFSEATVRDADKRRANRETLSMVMVDYDFDGTADVFDFDDVFYAGAIADAEWRVCFPAGRLGERMMAVFVDIYGNEARVVIPATDFAPAPEAKAIQKAKPGTKTPARRRGAVA